MEEYQCPLCSQKVSRDLAKYREHMEEHIIAEIKTEHPSWVDSGGVCLKCYEHFKKQMGKED